MNREREMAAGSVESKDRGNQGCEPLWRVRGCFTCGVVSGETSSLRGGGD